MSFDLESLMDDMLAGVGGDAADAGSVSVADASDAEVFEGYDVEEVGDIVNVVDAEDAQDAVPPSWGKQGKESAVEVIVVAPAKREVVQAAFADVTGVGAGSGASVTVTQRAVSAKGEGKVDLMDAQKQWATRPADERFWTIKEMAQRCSGYKESSAEVRVDLGRVQVVNEKGDMLLMGGGLNGPAKFTHYSFGQLCQVAGAPAGYLRELDGQLASQCLESGLRRKDRDMLGGSGNVLVREFKGTDQRVGAFLSSGYSRIWNADVVERLQEFESRGWKVPPARPAGFDDPRARIATEDDVLKNNKGGGGLSVKVGDLIAPAGLYASDRDMFAFMVSEGGFEEGGSVMNRGFFVSNSEVGDRAFGVTTFLYDAVCGNHIVWGASEVTEVRLIHRGKASSRWIGDLQRALQRYSATGTEKERRAIVAAIGCQLGDNRDEVVEKLFKDKKLGLTKRVLEQAWEWSVKEARLRGNKFSPTSVWGMICGLTRVSQEIGWAADRVAIDQAAGKMLVMAS